MRLSYVVAALALIAFLITTPTQTISSKTSSVRVEVCGLNNTCISVAYGVFSVKPNSTVKVYVNNTLVFKREFKLEEHIVFKRNSLVIKPVGSQVNYKLHTCFSGIGCVGYFEVQVSGVNLENATVKEFIIRGLRLISFPEWLVKESLKKGVIHVPPAGCNAPQNTLVKTGDYVIVEVSWGNESILVTYKASIKPPVSSGVSKTISASSSKTAVKARTVSAASVSIGSPVTSIPVYSESRSRGFNINYIFIALVAAGVLLLASSSLKRGFSNASS